jgi:hypothetical protein
MQDDKVYQNIMWTSTIKRCIMSIFYIEPNAVQVGLERGQTKTRRFWTGWILDAIKFTTCQSKRYLWTNHLIGLQVYGCKKMPDCFSSYPSCLSVSHRIHSIQESLNSMFHVSSCHWLRVSEIDRGIQIHKCYIYLYLFTWRMVALWTRPCGRRGRLSGNFSSKYCTGHQIRLEDTRVIDKVFHQISWIQLDKRSCQMIDCRKTVDYAKIRLICKS